MGEGEKNTEYKRSRLSSSDRGIRIIGLTKEEDLKAGFMVLRRMLSIMAK